MDLTPIRNKNAIDDMGDVFEGDEGSFSDDLTDDMNNDDDDEKSGYLDGEGGFMFEKSRYSSESFVMQMRLE